MDIQYADINELLQSDDGALEFFDSLPKDVQKALLARGGGINNYDELAHFADIVMRRGYRDTTEHADRME